MAVLEEMQFEILPYADADEGVPFGIGLNVSVTEGGFKPGGPQWYTEDAENPINGATAYGQDHLLGTTWSWELHVNRDRTTTAVASLAELAKIWRAKEIREVIGAVTCIRYRLAGRTRRVYGRPRLFDYELNNLILYGKIDFDATFSVSDSLIYDDESESVTMTLSDEDDPTAGVILPAIFPLVMNPRSNGGDSALVDGDEDTYPVIRFEGPVTNPSVSTSDWEISLDMTLDEGEAVEVDARPWAQTVLFNHDTSVAGALGSRQYLSRVKLSPGTHDFAFRADAAGDGASCEIRWRSAWNSI